MEEPRPAPQRERLESDRTGLVHKFKVDGTKCYLNVGLYPDGRPGEIFLNMDKVGSAAHGFADSWALLFSVALQYGIPLCVLTEKFRHVKFEPRGVTESRNPELRFADSVVDYVARWLESKFGKEPDDGRV